MKKAKQVLAIVGIILLVALYVSTLIFAIFDNPKTFTLLGASVAATIVIPVMLWVMGVFLRIAKKDDNEK
ncbi:MAG: hypothetical protein J6Z06_01665 [Lachnospiraceae bacterium]|jgi:hypothetical protein|nr:hypothetical protein [Lachnospiraceae bacterium]